MFCRAILWHERALPVFCAAGVSEEPAWSPRSGVLALRRKRRPVLAGRTLVPSEIRAERVMLIEIYRWFVKMAERTLFPFGKHHFNLRCFLPRIILFKVSPTFNTSRKSWMVFLRIIFPLHSSTISFSLFRLWLPAFQQSPLQMSDIASD